MIHNKIYDVMKEFLSDYNKQVYGRGLIGKVDMSPKGIALILNKLEKEKILISKKRAGVKYFSLNKKNVLIKRYIIVMEIINSIKFLERNLKFKHIIDKLIKPSQIVCIFGSYAKGNQKRKSDIDLFIVGDFNEKQIKEINEEYKIKISVKNTSKSNFIKSIKENNPLINEILTNHILLSGYDEFVREVIKQKW
jgi:predicted nucleotidyltransferase